MISDIDFEHMLRDRITLAKNLLEKGILAGGKEHLNLYSSVHFDTDGKWRVNTWGAGTDDITTKGAMLFTVVNEHIDVVRRQDRLNDLPMRITHDDQQKYLSPLQTDDNIPF